MDSSHLKMLFGESIAVVDADRESWLTEQCAGDLVLERKCLALLRAHEEAQRAGFLAVPDPTAITAPTKAIPEEPLDQPLDIPDHELIRPLARGGFGHVWLARNRHTDRYCAIKIVDYFFDAELEGIRHLQHCTERHPHLLPIDHVGVSDARLFCIMPLADNAATAGKVTSPSEYVPCSLETEVKRKGPWTESAIADLGVGLADALQSLHQSGLVHGDVKPPNVLRVDGRWTLADYSLVGSADADAPRGRSAGYTPTEGGGSPGADVYALGKTLAFASTGKAPTDPCQSTPMRSELRRAVERMCSTDPSARGTATQALQDLKRVKHATSRRHTRTLVLSCAALIALLAIGRMIIAPTIVEPPSFTAHLFRGNPAIDRGRPAELPGPASPGDGLCFDVRFDKSRHAYLFACLANGQIVLCAPDTSATAPMRTSTLIYPEQSDEGVTAYWLDEGTGAYLFVLVTGTADLPAFDAWQAQLADQNSTSLASTWQRALDQLPLPPQPYKLRFAQGKQTDAGTSRGASQRAVADQPLRDMLASISREKHVAWVDALVVPVED
ncbi:MAG: hypothetical protein KDA20_13160 [Phycisphaerales bacterium]|nr:hypothetical protein [Phycisphaerales bacterium]